MQEPLLNHVEDLRRYDGYHMKESWPAEREGDGEVAFYEKQLPNGKHIYLVANISSIGQEFPFEGVITDIKEFTYCYDRARAEFRSRAKKPIEGDPA